MVNILKKIALLSLILVVIHKPIKASDTIETSGDILRILIPSIAYGMTFYLDDRQGREEFYKSFLTTTLVTYGLKYSVDKQRPNKEDNHSFPSGHTSITAQSATFLHQRYGLTYALPAYVGAVFTGYSRVESDNHYTIDVLAGAMVGMLSSYYFTTSYKGVKINPYVTKGIAGFTLSKNW